MRYRAPFGAGGIKAGTSGPSPIFNLALSDSGSGVLNTTPSIAAGSATATFTRALAAYTTLSTGVLSQVATNTARSCYSSNGATYLGGLFEPAATNLCLQSQTLQTTWSRGAGMNAPTADNVVAPDGTTTADTLTPISGASDHRLFQALTTTNATHTASFFVKAGAASFVGTSFDTAVQTANPAGAFFNVSTGTLGTVGAGVTATITQSGNSFYRVTDTAASGGLAPTITIEPFASDNQTFNYNAAGTETIAAWGAQVELGSVATSYIATTTVSATRPKDVLQYSATSNITVNSTIALTWTPYATGLGTVFLYGTYVDASNYTAILHDGTNIIARKRIAGANNDATKALAIAAGTSYRIVARFDGTNGVDVWVAGVKGSNNATTTAAQVGTTFQIGADGNGSSQPYGCIKGFLSYGSGLTDGQAASL